MTEKKCARCGNSNLEPGRLQSTGVLSFRPDNAKFLTLKTSDVPIRANICLDCGTLDIVGDVRKTRTLTERVKPA